MILLLGTTDSLAVITASGVANIDMHCSYMDYNAGAVTPGSTNNVVSTATTTTVAAAPGSGIQRNVKTLVIHNTNASSSNLVTVEVVSSATAVLYAYTLLAGETLQYYDTLGFEVLDASGGRKVTPATGLFLRRTIYTSGTSQNHAPLSNTHSLYVQVVGGGGGGGASGAGNNNNSNAGAGGGAGGYVSKRYVYSGTQTYTYTVGGGGPGGTVPGNTGTAGTASTFTDGTTLITANGGAGGPGGPTIAAAFLQSGGAGAAVSTNGDFNGAGDPGSPSVKLAAGITMSGSGASSLFGGGANGAVYANTAGAVGASAAGYGSGGAGGGCNNSTGQGGGPGSAGVIIVDEYS